MASSTRISLAELPKAIVDVGGAPTTYLRAYHACVAGLIPAERSSTGRWSVAKCDIGSIAVTLQSLAVEAQSLRRDRRHFEPADPVRIVSR